MSSPRNLDDGTFTYLGIFDSEKSLLIFYLSELRYRDLSDALFLHKTKLTFTFSLVVSVLFPEHILQEGG